MYINFSSRAIIYKMISTILISKTCEITTMRYIMRDIISMPYFRNHKAAAANEHIIYSHEESVERIFKNNGLNAVRTKLLRNEKKDLILQNDPQSKLAKMSYVKQPYGPQNSPDFIIKCHNTVFAFECKSSKRSVPIYNSGGLSRHYIYIFCSERSNQTTIYMGDDIVTKEQNQLIDEYVMERRESDYNFNKKLASIDTNKRGINFYTRPMIGQKGGRYFTNYFTHQYRSLAEGNVFKFIQDKIKS